MRRRLDLFHRLLHLEIVTKLKNLDPSLQLRGVFFSLLSIEDRLRQRQRRRRRRRRRLRQKNVVLTSQRRQNDKRSVTVRANVFEVFKKVLSSKLYLYEKFDLNVTYW